VSFADVIGKAKDLNCKIIFLKHWKILFLFHLSKTFNDFFIFSWLSNFNQFSMTFPWLSRKIYFSRIFNDFPWPWEPCFKEIDFAVNRLTLTFTRKSCTCFPAACIRRIFTISSCRLHQTVYYTTYDCAAAHNLFHYFQYASITSNVGFSKSTDDFAMSAEQSWRVARPALTYAWLLQQIFSRCYPHKLKEIKTISSANKTCNTKANMTSKQYNNRIHYQTILAKYSSLNNIVPYIEQSLWWLAIYN